MSKAIFFSGCGTVYTTNNTIKRNMEIFPETLPALRFLARRGYCFILVSSEFQEYQLLQNGLKDKTIPLLFWNGREDDLDNFLENNCIDLEDSYFVTDSRYLQEALTINGWQIILVLTGKGVETLQNIDSQQLEKITDICKDIYAAAISIVLNSPLRRFSDFG